MHSVHTDEVQALIDQYGGIWGEHPHYPRKDWVAAVSEGYSVLGYWETVHIELYLKAQGFDDKEHRPLDDPRPQY